MLSEKKILFTDTSDKKLKKLISRMDYEPIEFFSLEEMMSKAVKEHPSLIIGDLSQMGKPIHEVCQLLKNDILVRHIPLIIVSKKNAIHDRIQAYENGATDYIIHPFEEKEITTRIKRSIRDTKLALDANPLTHLPGNISIHENLERLLKEKKPFAVAYFDIDHFKSFNDFYGYTQGDQIILLSSHLLLECREKSGDFKKDIFVGHVGGDDFVVIGPEKTMESFCMNFISQFDASIINYYDPETAKQGFILGRNRKGEMTQFPLISISIAIVINNEGKKFSHIGQIASSGAEIKKYLKV